MRSRAAVAGRPEIRASAPRSPSPPCRAAGSRARACSRRAGGSSARRGDVEAEDGADPLVGSSSPRRILISVLLPAPFAPTRPTIPGSSSSVSPSSAVTAEPIALGQGGRGDQGRRRDESHTGQGIGRSVSGVAVRPRNVGLDRPPDRRLSPDRGRRSPPRPPTRGRGHPGRPDRLDGCGRRSRSGRRRRRGAPRRPAGDAGGRARRAAADRRRPRGARPRRTRTARPPRIGPPLRRPVERAAVEPGEEVAPVVRDAATGTASPGHGATTGRPPR